MIHQQQKTAKYRFINEIQQSNFKMNSQRKTCSYRYLDTSKFDCSASSHIEDYNQYTLMFSSCESSALHSESQINEKLNFSTSTEEVVHEQREDVEEIDQIMHFLESKKENIYKNIINGFYTHILKCKNKELMSVYENLLNHEWDFKYIQKRVKKSYKQCNRLNLKLKNLMSKNKLNKVFLYFLENYEKLWLDNSKVKNKELYQQSINMLLRAQEFDILDDNIKYYRKQKKILAN